MALLPAILLVLAVVAVPISRRVTGDFFHPAALFVAIWSLAVGLFLLYLLPFEPPGPGTLFVVLASVALMAAGTFVGQWLERRRPPSAARAVPPARAWVWVLSGLGLAGIAWYVAEIVSIFGWPGLRDAFTVRTALGARAIPSTFLILELFCIAAPILAAALALSGQKLRARDWIGPVACALGTWLTTDRAHFFLIVLTIFFMFVLCHGPRLSWARLFVAGATAFTLLATNFLVVGAWTGKSAANLGVPLQLPWTVHARRGARRPPASAIERLLERSVETTLQRGITIYLYTTASYAALGQLMREPAGPPRALYTIYPVTRLLERVHVVEPRLRQAPRLNILTSSSPRLEYNVYTFLYEPLVDFGRPGAVAYAGLIGVLSGFAYGRLVRRRASPASLLVMGQIATALTLSIFANRFTNTLSWYVFLATLAPVVLAARLGPLSRDRTASQPASGPGGVAPAG